MTLVSSTLLLSVLPSECLNVASLFSSCRTYTDTHQSLRPATLRICYVMPGFILHLLANVAMLPHRRKVFLKRKASARMCVYVQGLCAWISHTPSENQDRGNWAVRLRLYYVLQQTTTIIKIGLQIRGRTKRPLARGLRNNLNHTKFFLFFISNQKG